MARHREGAIRMPEEMARCAGTNRSARPRPWCRRLPDVDGPPDRPRPESRQRWRLVARRAGDAPSLTQRELADAWEAAAVASGLPVTWTDAATSRVRLSFGAPLQAGIAAEAELIDLFLTD